MLFFPNNFKLLVSSYGYELHKETLLLQSQQLKKAIAKNQLIFLQKYIHHKITPKSFETKETNENQKGINIIAKNGTKQWMHEAAVKVKQICESLKKK